jgi:transposase InsO family protein
MKVEDVTDTLTLALTASGCDTARVEHKPRLLSDNGPCYIAADLGDWLEQRSIEQAHGAPGHPQTQGKIERWHQTLKNRILLETIASRRTLRPRSQPSSIITIIADITSVSPI